MTGEDKRFAMRMQRWERKLAKLEEGSDEYNRHLKNKPKVKAAPQAKARKAGKARKTALSFKGSALQLRLLKHQARTGASGRLQSAVRA